MHIRHLGLGHRDSLPTGAAIGFDGNLDPQRGPAHFHDFGVEADQISELDRLMGRLPGGGQLSAAAEFEEDESNQVVRPSGESR
jgi:hypothetical protein